MKDEEEFDFPDGPMGVDDWGRLYEFLERKGKIPEGETSEIPLDVFDWRKRLAPMVKAEWAKILDMNPQEFGSFLLDFFEDSVFAISKGGAVAFIDYSGRINKIYNLPICWGNLPPGMKQNLPEQLTLVSNFLGLVTSREDNQYKRICGIGSHDWRETGDYFVTFADNSRRTYNDQDRGFQKFYRKPFLLNPSTFPTFEKFLLTFCNIGGNFEQLAEDYKTLFQEALPPPRQGLLKYIK